MQELKSISKKKLGIIIGVLLIAGIVLSVGFLFINKQKTSTISKNPQAEIKDITTRVGKLMDLPADETPAVATVSDVTKLKDQDFFKNAENGDKVLAYTKNKKAIIYRPSKNKIIEVAFYNPPVADTQQASGSAQQVAGVVAPMKASEKVKVAIYNGTKTAGLAKSKGTEISGKFTQVEIGTTANATADFAETMVIDLSGKNKTLTTDIAKSLNGKVGTMPSGEAKPDADILVILGAK